MECEQVLLRASEIARDGKVPSLGEWCAKLVEAGIPAGEVWNGVGLPGLRAIEQSTFGQRGVVPSIEMSVEHWSALEQGQIPDLHLPAERREPLMFARMPEGTRHAGVDLSGRPMEIYGADHLYGVVDGLPMRVFEKNGQMLAEFASIERDEDGRANVRGKVQPIDLMRRHQQDPWVDVLRAVYRENIVPADPTTGLRDRPICGVVLQPGTTSLEKDVSGVRGFAFKWHARTGNGEDYYYLQTEQGWGGQLQRTQDGEWGVWLMQNRFGMPQGRSKFFPVDLVTNLGRADTVLERTRCLLADDLMARKRREQEEARIREEERRREAREKDLEQARNLTLRWSDRGRGR